MRSHIVPVSTHSKLDCVEAPHDAADWSPFCSDSPVLFEHVAKKLHMYSSRCVHCPEILLTVSAKLSLENDPFHFATLANRE